MGKNKNTTFFRSMLVLSVITGFVFWVKDVWAAGGGSDSHGHGAAAGVFLWIAIILIAAKLASLVEKIGQPAVLGELLIGVVLGNLVLLGFDFFEPLKHESIILFLSELGVVILLFQIGLESSIEEMLKVGKNALNVAILGVVVPFRVGTYLVGPWLMPGHDFNTYLFLGATMTATSVGITARVFKDLGKLNTPEAKIVLGAAVIDDVLGLVILAVVSVIVTTGSVSMGMVSWITAKAILFLVGAIVLGKFLAPSLTQLFSKINAGIGMKFTVAVSACLLLAYAAQAIDLAPIVGAFAAGLVLKPVHFKLFNSPQIVTDMNEAVSQADGQVKAKVSGVLDKYKAHHLDHLLESLGYFMVPIFFVMTGVNVRLETLFDTQILLVALGVTVAAILGKIVSGFAAGPVSKPLVGWGMVPRGEVGLIFAMIGKSLGVVNDNVFSITVIMVILTTLVTPPMLTFLIKQKHKKS